MHGVITALSIGFALPDVLFTSPFFYLYLIFRENGQVQGHNAVAAVFSGQRARGGVSLGTRQCVGTEFKTALRIVSSGTYHIVENRVRRFQSHHFHRVAALA